VTGIPGGQFRGFVERDRPFIDDQPDRKYGWEAHSRWGSRPVRQFGRVFARGAARVMSLSHRAWTRISARSKSSGMTVLLAELLLVGSALAGLASCAEARAVSTETGRIDQVRLGFALGPEGRVSPGCAATTFSLHDPIHLSMQVTDAAVGSVVRVSVQNVLTKRVAWSEARAVTPGSSFMTFEIGSALAVGRYRAESTFGGEARNFWPFVVHDRRPGVR
jgi:hypothetical protein